MDSFISWVGGKKLLRRKILEQFPSNYKKYVEVFGGAGWILFAEERKGVCEVYNDKNSDLVNLFRVVKYHPEALQKELEGILVARELFFDCRDQLNTRGLTDIQRAARFFVTIKESFGSELKTFRCNSTNLTDMVCYLKEAGKRLQRVVIENQGFDKILRTYDREHTLFYLDPPYYGAEKHYQENFAEEDHLLLANLLGKLKGRFILSYNDCPEIRELYKGYKIIPVERNSNLTTKTTRDRYKELIIKNY